MSNVYKDPLDELLSECNFNPDFNDLQFDTMMLDIENASSSSSNAMSSSDSSPQLSSSQVPCPFELWDCGASSMNDPQNCYEFDLNATINAGETEDVWIIDSSSNTHDEIEDQKFHRRDSSTSTSTEIPRTTKLVPICPAKPIQNNQIINSSEQNRKIRNRMYAQASRQRKKNEVAWLRTRVADLEQEVKELHTKNEILETEVAFLKRTAQVASYLTSPNGKRKCLAAGTMLAVVGIFALFTPFSITNDKHRISEFISNDRIDNIKSSRFVRTSGRIILDDQESTERIVQNMTYHNSSDCSPWKLNATEAERVTNVINQWVRVHSSDGIPIKFGRSGFFNKEAMKAFNARRNIERIKLLPKTKNEDGTALNYGEQAWKQLELLNKYPINDKARIRKQNINKVASMIRQKPDRLYIVALQDFFLLPSLKKRFNENPKISLILPNQPISGKEETYSFIRIDCDVTSTGQLKLSSSELKNVFP